MTPEELKRAEELAERCGCNEYDDDAWEAYSLLPALVAEVKRLQAECASESKANMKAEIVNLRAKIEHLYTERDLQRHKVGKEVKPT